jgi:hypothetical protein
MSEFCTDGLMMVKRLKHVQIQQNKYVMLCLTETSDYIVFFLTDLYAFIIPVNFKILKKNCYYTSFYGD